MTAAPATDRACDNCGDTLLGAYCHHCGAPEVVKRDLPLRRFAAELVEEFTSVEHSKLLRTLIALVFRPGLLTREYFTGRRIRYIRPVTLCLTMLALNVFVYSVSSSVSMFDIGKTGARSEAFLRSRGMVSRNSISGRIEREAAAQHVPVATVENQINDRWARNVSLLQIPLIVFFAGVLRLAYLRSRKFAVEHWVFATHFISFQALFVALMWPLYYLTGIQLSGAAAMVAIVNTAVTIGYLFAAVRTFYGDSAKQALVRAPLLYIGYFIVFALTYQLAMILALGSSLGR